MSTTTNSIDLTAPLPANEKHRRYRALLAGTDALVTVAWEHGDREVTITRADRPATHTEYGPIRVVLVSSGLWRLEFDRDLEIEITDLAIEAIPATPVDAHPPRTPFDPANCPANGSRGNGSHDFTHAATFVYCRRCGHVIPVT